MAKKRQAENRSLLGASWPPSRLGGSTAAPDAEGVDARAGALLPPQLLQPGEMIILLIKPSPLYVVLGAVRSLVVIVLATVAGYLLVQAVPRLGVTQAAAVALGIAAGAVRLGWQFLEWLSRVYVLSDLRVISVGGVLRVRIFEAPLHHIQHTDLILSLRERLFGLGTLLFSTAGTSLSEGAWVMVEKPLDVHAKVVQTIRRYRK